MVVDTRIAVAIFGVPASINAGADSLGCCSSCQCHRFWCSCFSNCCFLSLLLWMCLLLDVAGTAVLTVLCPGPCSGLQRTYQVCQLACTTLATIHFFLNRMKLASLILTNDINTTTTTTTTIEGEIAAVVATITATTMSAAATTAAAATATATATAVTHSMRISQSLILRVLSV